jgi:hypothetical protein
MAAVPLVLRLKEGVVRECSWDSPTAREIELADGTVKKSLRMTAWARRER